VRLDPFVVPGFRPASAPAPECISGKPLSLAALVWSIATTPGEQKN